MLGRHGNGSRFVRSFGSLYLFRFVVAPMRHNSRCIRVVSNKSRQELLRCALTPERLCRAAAKVLLSSPAISTRMLLGLDAVISRCEAARNLSAGFFSRYEYEYSGAFVDD